MAIQLTYFVHGTTTDNENNISTGWNQGELSELGIRQSKELRNQTQGQNFDVVFCSDLERAMITAQLAFAGRAPIIPDVRLRECNYGELNGGDSKVVEPLQEDVRYKFPSGESYEDVKARINEFLKFLRKNYDGQSVAIVSHKAPQIALDVLLKNMTWEQALASDWRKTKSPPSSKLRRTGWQPGWKYVF